MFMDSMLWSPTGNLLFSSEIERVAQGVLDASCAEAGEMRTGLEPEDMPLFLENVYKSQAIFSLLAKRELFADTLLFRCVNQPA